jgi:hypothetical protein
MWKVIDFRNPANKEGYFRKATITDRTLLTERSGMCLNPYVKKKRFVCELHFVADIGH